MIDFHSHIIPNVDDGSKSIEETFNLIKEAKEVGFDSIISTSHYMEEYYEVSAPERRVWIDAIQQGLNQQAIDVKLYLGNEIYITPNIIELLKEEKATTINQTSYVLFELPLGVDSEPMNLYDIIYEMQENKLVPILAHPERYVFVQKSPELIYDLIQKGVLMQVNYGSIVGRYGEKAQIIAEKLLTHKMVHFLGTDVHKQNTIYPKIPFILSQLRELIGEERLEEITTINPSLVLENKKIDIDDPIPFKLSLKEKIKINFK